MIRVLTAFILILTASWTSFSQDKALLKAAKNGQPIPTQINVANNVTAQAVLIPRVDARRIFGDEIANNYAVIEINVGNKTPDAALIIHGIFIDYSRWALSGATSQTSFDGGLRETSQPFQASTRPNQIASEEYRVVRGQLLDAQMWSKRNWTMRLLTLVGSLASAYSFSIGEEGIVRGINAFTGVAVPGVREAWPDGTIEQLNRISDFGYQANKVIPKQGAEVIVCFFPIDRFLTPGFKKLFLKSPALFFSPMLMLVDPALKSDTNRLLKGINNKLNVDNLRQLMPCYHRVVRNLQRETVSDASTPEAAIIQGADTTCESAFGLVSVTDARGKRTLKIENSKFENFMALDFISQMSLNFVSVTIDGVMSVETTTIPAKIDSVAFDSIANCDDACFWADVQKNGGVRTAVISGSYLTGGNVVIDEARALGIEEITSIPTRSNDQELHFSFKLTKGIAPQTSLHFVVSKTQGSTPGQVDSTPREVLVGYSPLPPEITELKRNGAELTVTGSRFFPIPPNSALKVQLTAPDGMTTEVKPSSTKSEELKVTIPKPQLPGCWKVRVFVGALFSLEKSICQ